MKRCEIASLFAAPPAEGAVVTVAGWAKTVRDSKNIGFIELSDGSSFKNLQVVFEAARLDNFKEIAKCGVGTALLVTGRIVLTPGAKQPLELNADSIVVEGVCPPGVPAAEKAPQRGVFAHDAPSAGAHQHVQRRFPGAQ